MNTEGLIRLTPRMRIVIDELKCRIASRHPEAAFEVSEGSDPEGVYLTAIVDVEDLFEVTDPLLDHLVDLQVGENLPIFVIPGRTPARNAALSAGQRDARDAVMTSS